MKKIIKCLIALSIIFSCIWADNTNYKEIFKNNINTVITQLNSLSTVEERQQYLNKQIPNLFSFKYIALWSLGSYVRKVNKAELNDYINVVSSYMLNYYGSLLVTYYKDFDFKFLGGQDLGRGDYLVFTKVVHKDYAKDKSKPVIEVNWKMKYNKADEQYYVVDVIVNTISLLNAQRSEFEGILNANNGDINVLKQAIQSKTLK